MDMGHIKFLRPVCPAYQYEVYIDQSKKWYRNRYTTSSVISHAYFLPLSRQKGSHHEDRTTCTRVGTLIVATVYLQLIQN